MRKLVVLTLVAMFAITGIALAAYQSGKYEQGAQSGFKATGIRIDIAQGSFNVERILMHETCSASGHPSIHDYGGFQEATGTKLHGAINAHGSFSGIWKDSSGDYTKVTGHISGKTLSVSGNEYSRYKPSGSTVTYTCRASGTFHPTRVG
jgi:hypothetical protein